MSVARSLANSRQYQEHLQDRLGDQSEEHHRYVGRPWRLHLPISKLEHSLVQPDLCSAHLYALLRLEEGSQDWHGEHLSTFSFGICLIHRLQYYLRTRPAVGAIQFTVSAATLAEAKQQNADGDSAKAAALQAAPSVAPDSPPKSVAPMAISGTGAGADTTPVALKSRDVLGELKVAPQQPKLIDPTLSPAPRSPDVDSADEEEITYEEALKRKEARELEQEKLMCSLTNKEACVVRLFLQQIFSADILCADVQRLSVVHMHSHRISRRPFLVDHFLCSFSTIAPSLCNRTCLCSRPLLELSPGLTRRGFLPNFAFAARSPS